MKQAIRKTTTAIAAVATAGVGTMFLGAAPAAAATETCGPTGTLIATGICELVFTEDGVFTRTAEMTKLEVLLVGSGGDAVIQPRVTTGEFPSAGYAAAGGGGEVRVVDFSTASGDVEVTIGSSGGDTEIVDADDAAIYEYAAGGGDGTGGSEGTGNGGESGSGNDGQSFTNPSSAAYGAGGGDGGIGLGNVGGAGTTVNTLVLAGSLFATDTRCFGGGGGAGFIPLDGAAVTGNASCGGGSTAPGATALVAPVANSGGGAGASNITVTEAELIGADGYVAVRWPSTPVLANTGSESNTVAMSIGISALVAGIALAFAAAYTRRRSAE